MLHALLILLALPTGHDPSHGHDHGHDPEHPGSTRQEVSPRAAAPTGPVHVGRGAHRYRWETDWLELPEGRAGLGPTHGCLVVDNSGRVYLSAESGPAVQVYTREGAPLLSFGEDWGAGLHGMAIATEMHEVEGLDGETRPVAREVLYLAHTARREVLKTTLSGEVLQRYAPPPTEAGLYEEPGQYKPTSVAVAPDGRLFVADGYGRSYVHRYDAQGEYLDSFGGRGEGPEHLNTPHGLWLDTSGERPTLLVADRENHRIARFDLEGGYLGGTDPESGLLRRPCHLQFTGELAVVADLAGRVTLLDRELRLVAHLGDHPDPAQRARYDVPREAWVAGAFCAPHCARIGPKGEIYVMDWNASGRLTRLVPAPEEPESAPQKGH